jgi:hypothetical protein
MDYRIVIDSGGLLYRQKPNLAISLSAIAERPSLQIRQNLQFHFWQCWYSGNRLQGKVPSPLLPPQTRKNGGLLPVVPLRGLGRQQG